MSKRKPSAQKAIKPACGTCQFYEPDGMQGTCHERPPQIFVNQTQRIVTEPADAPPIQQAVGWIAEFPPVLPTSWCGRWRSAK